jgi:flagellar motor switch protein FliM
VTEHILEQQEIDQLLQAVREGKLPTSKDSLVPLLDAAPMDFSVPGWSQDRIIRRPLPVLDLVFERLCPLIQITLTKSLRFPIRAESFGVELQKFGDFRESFEAQPCLFEVMRLDPLRGYSVMVFPSNILYALIDALMGGLGVGEMPADREVSDIEASLLEKPHVEALRDLENAFKPWFPLQAVHVRADRNARVFSTIGDDEVCHVGKIVIAGDVLPSSPIYFALPYSSLEPLLEATSGRAGEESDPNWRVNLERNLGESRARVSAILGRKALTASAVHALAEGDVLELDRKLDEDVDFLVENEPVYKARIGRSGPNYAVRITNRCVSKREFVDRTSGQKLVRKGLITSEQLAVAQVDERINRRLLLDSIVSRGWVERRVLEAALQN